jgi:hypothetical protein
MCLIQHLILSFYHWAESVFLMTLTITRDLNIIFLISQDCFSLLYTIRPLFTDSMILTFMFSEGIINGLLSLFVTYIYHIIWILSVWSGKCPIAVRNEIRSFLWQTRLKTSSCTFQTTYSFCAGHKYWDFWNYCVCCVASSSRLHPLFSLTALPWSWRHYKSSIRG